MKNTKEFTITVEQEFKIVLDMDKYTPEALESINDDYYGYFKGERLAKDDEEPGLNTYHKDETLEEIAKDIVYQRLQGNSVSNIEGFPIDGQKCMQNGEAYFRVDFNE